MTTNMVMTVGNDTLHLYDVFNLSWSLHILQAIFLGITSPIFSMQPP